MIDKDSQARKVTGLDSAATADTCKKPALDLQILGFVVESATDAVYIFDEHRKLLYVNPKACQQTGYTRDELLQMNLSDLDGDYPVASSALYHARADRKEQVIVETWHRRKDGQRFPVEVSLAVARFNDRIYTSAFVRDITRRKAMQQQTEHLRFALENATDAIYIYDRTGTIHYANTAACEVLGYSQDEINSIKVVDLDPLFSENNNLAFWDDITRRVMTKQTLHRRKDGSTYPVEIIATATSYGDKESAVCFVRDVSDRIRAENAIRESEERFRMIADTSPVALVIFEVNEGAIRYVNAQAARTFHLTRSTLEDYSIQSLLQAAGVEADFIKRVLTGQEFHNREVQLVFHEQTTWLSLNSSALMLDGKQMICCAMMDVTEARELSNQLSYQATYDDLTGLVNRREFEDRLQEVIDMAHERRLDNALCYLDLDQFKVINDTCGHMAGDELLRQLAQELYRCVRRDDTLARLGGDEFAILLENCTLENAEKVANNVRNAVQNFRFIWHDSVFTVGVSVGLTQIGQEGETLSEVLRRADAACYAAKEAGRNRLHVFRLDDRELALRHVEMQWVSRINAALEEDRFELWFQEIAEINHPDEVLGRTAEDHFEILLRMRDSNGELAMPTAFLSAAERYDLAPKIDRWVVRKVFSWLSSNAHARNRLGLCAVNISGQTLGDENFHQEVISILESSNLPAERICFEITETSAITNLASATQFMGKLKQHGCTFALDDFGRGLSSFAYLKNLPVDFVKIDGFFVQDILIDPVNRAMVKAIIDMAHALGKKAIAEFVENDEILHELIDLHVDYVQGFGIAKPMPLK